MEIEHLSFYNWHSSFVALAPIMFSLFPVSVTHLKYLSSVEGDGPLA